MKKFQKCIEKAPEPSDSGANLVTRRGFEPRTHCLKGRILNYIISNYLKISLFFLYFSKFIKEIISF